MATIAQIKAYGDTATVTSSPLAEPLNAPLRFEERLERFGEHYNKSQDSHLYKFLVSLCGDAGAGSLKREKLYPRLQQMLGATYFQDIDKLYGNPIGISRLPVELYIYDPKNEALTSDQWIEVFSKDASYRERCLTWMRAIIEGPTPRGIALAAEAACGIECDVFENYKYIDNAQLTRPSSRLLYSDSIITDKLRDAMIEGDGRLLDRSFGVWPATQNLVINGNIATGLSGWSTAAYANHSKVSGITATVDNSQFKFANSVYYDNATNVVSSTTGNSLHLVGTAANQGIHQDIGVTTNGVQYVASAWIKRVGTSGDVKLTLGAASNSSITVVPTTTWTQYFRTWTSNGSATAFSVVQSGATNIDVYVDGLMVEQIGEVRATPFAVTSRVAPDLALPNPETKLSNSKGWIAMRVRPEWAAIDAIGTGGGGKAMLWSWRGAENTGMIRCYFNDTGNVWTIERQNYINPVVQTHTVAATHAKGDVVDVTAVWSGSVIKITIGSTELGSGTTISIPIQGLTGGTFYIGHDQGSSAFQGEILSMAMGNTDPPTQATLVPLMSQDAADPTTFPAGTTGYWTADNGFYFSTGSDQPGTFQAVQSVTNSRNEFIILPHTTDIDQREKRAINRLVDKLRPVDTIATISYAEVPRAEVAINDLGASSTRFNILRYVIGNESIEWPPPEPAMGYWIDTDYKEAPTFAFMDRQESATYVSVKSVTASSEHIGQFSAFQKSLFSFLGNLDDYKVFSAQNLYTKNVAPITVSTPWMKETRDEKLIVNNHYPIGYFSDINLNITVPETSGDFWASDEKYAPATEEIIIDLDVTRPFNFIDFNISQKPIDIAIDWWDNDEWIPIAIKEGFAANFEVNYLPTVENPWAYLEYNFDLVTSNKIRITFTRRDDVFLLDDTSDHAFSIEVQNLRVIHLITSIDDFVIDSGTDILGNNFETSSFEYEVENVIDDDNPENYYYWQSQPNPTRHAVEALYFDISNSETFLTIADIDLLDMRAMDSRSMTQLSDFFTSPSVIDEVYINPITNGPSMHFYYSLDDTPDWDDKLWIPIPINYTLRRGYFALPSPTAVKYFKIEFSDLAPVPYQFIEYPSGITTTFRRFPTWVQNYFADLYPIKPYDENIEVQELIKIDPLKYGYQSYLDALSTGYADIREQLFQDTSIEVREFIEDVVAQGQQQRKDTTQAESRIRFFSPLIYQDDLIKLLDPVKAIVRKIQQTRSQLVDDDEWSSEMTLPITVPPVQKSMESLAEPAADKQSPILYFPRFCRHAYQLVEARFINKVAYHVAIGDVKFLRRDLSVKRDDPIYLETLEDDAHILNNTLVRKDQYRWGP